MKAMPVAVSTLLPPDARMLLVAAASTPGAAERTKAIEEVTARLRLRYPKFFQQAPLAVPTL